MMKQFLWLSLSAILLFACNDSGDDSTTTTSEPTNSTSTNKIMPLGASRVEGHATDYESFRYELWKDLIDGGHAFDFVGTQDDPTVYSTYNGNTFDVHHEGRSGWTSGQILEELDGLLNKVSTPDIVLFSTPGGNDALQNLSYDAIISNINGIIDTFQSVNPNITIVIEKSAPARADRMDATLTSYMNQLKVDIETIASSQTTSTSQVIVVDMSTDFTEDLFADEVHYNEAGANFIAERYYNVLKGILQ